jgi:hypothetical protein
VFLGLAGVWPATSARRRLASASSLWALVFHTPKLNTGTAMVGEVNCPGSDGGLGGWTYATSLGVAY